MQQSYAIYGSNNFKCFENKCFTCPVFRAATTDECDCDKLDFPAAKVLSKEGLDQFSQERTTIAALNDRLVHLIELVSEGVTVSYCTYQSYFSFLLLGL